MNQLTISFIIPSYNEGDNIINILGAIQIEMSQLHDQYEVIFIDDGSSDETLTNIRALTFDHPEVKYLSFTRNFGKEAAVLAGLQHAKGNAVIIMDADLQHPPTMIHQLLQGFAERYNQVVAKRNRKGDSHIRSLTARLYYRFVNMAIIIT